MTRQDLIHKWAVYALALLPVWLLDSCILPRFPLFGITPMLLPLALTAVAVLDGLRIAGALISDRGDLPALLEVAVPECLLSLAWMPLIYLLFRAVYRKVGGDKLA